MRKIMQMVLTDFRIEFADRIAILFFLILPMVFTTVLGLAFSGQSSGGDGDQRIPMLVVQEDNGEMARQLIAALERSAVIRPLLHPADEAARLLEERSAPALVTIPVGWSARLRAGQTVELPWQQVPNDTRTLAVEQALRAAAAEVGSAVSAALVSTQTAAETSRVQAFADAAAQQRYFDEGFNRALALLQTPSARIEVIRPATANTGVAMGFEQSSVGQLVTWVLITLIGTAEVLVNERLGGTLRRVLTTPTGKATFLTGKVAGRLVLGLVQMALLIAFGALAFGVNWGRSPLALILVMLAFALSAVSFGTLLATFAKTRGQASGLIILFSMLTAALGGAWWPLEITPKIYQNVVRVLPTTWAMQGFSDVIIRGQGVSGVGLEVLILLGFTLLFLVLGIWRFRYE